MCSDVHGGSGRYQLGLTIKIDKTAPSVSGAALARAPDSNGWFNHPVAAAFSGQDAVSGIAGCSSPTYAGGDSASASRFRNVHGRRRQHERTGERRLEVRRDRTGRHGVAGP